MSNLPVPTDGWSDRDGDQRAIKGVIIKFSDAGFTRSKEGTPVAPTARFLVFDTVTMAVHWKGGKHASDPIYRQPGQDLAALVEHLNSQIPKSEWEDGLDGKPRTPWQIQRLLYLADDDTSEFFTFITSTVGGRIAIDNLREAVQLRRALRGAGLVPLIKLTTAPMVTRFGKRQRPAFEITGWRRLGGDLPQEPAPALAAPVDDKPLPNDKIPIGEELNDTVPF
jgi:hypothetical protein